MFKANENRYDNMIYRRCGKSGLKLSAVSLGLWKNFGAKDDFANMEKMVHTAFDLGIIHFDLANNYGDPDIGSAEVNFGKILDNGLRAYRDELCISTKAGYDMWPGPYGERNGSRKYLIASLDQSRVICAVLRWISSTVNKYQILEFFRSFRVLPAVIPHFLQSFIGFISTRHWVG